MSDAGSNDGGEASPSATQVVKNKPGEILAAMKPPRFSKKVDKIPMSFAGSEAFSWNDPSQHVPVPKAVINSLMKAMEDSDNEGSGSDKDKDKDKESPKKAAAPSGPRRHVSAREKAKRKKSAKKKAKAIRGRTQPAWDSSALNSAMDSHLLTGYSLSGEPWRALSLGEVGGVRPTKKLPPGGRLSQIAPASTVASPDMTRGQGPRALVPFRGSPRKDFAQTASVADAASLRTTRGEPAPESAYAALRLSQMERDDREAALNRVREKQAALAATHAGTLEGERMLTATLEREHYAEREKAREKERELERVRQEERERDRAAELRQLNEFEMERRILAERSRLLEQEAEAELEEERMREEQRRLEWEEEREREWEFFQDMEAERERAWERDRELERERLRLRMEEREKERELERERDRMRLTSLEHEFNVERSRWEELAAERELDIQRERAALRELQEERERELERDVIHMKERQKELAQRAEANQLLRWEQERIDHYEQERIKREFEMMLEAQEFRSILLDWEREIAWLRERARDQDRLAQRELVYAQEKLAAQRRLEEFEEECARIRDREHEFEEARQHDWELEREVEREREKEWALERHHEIERQMAHEHAQMLHREREAEREVLEALFEDRLLLEDVEWDRRKMLYAMEAESLEDIIQEFLAYSAEDIFPADMTERERLALEEDAHNMRDAEHATLTRELQETNQEAEELAHILHEAIEVHAQDVDEAIAASIADLTVEYRAWVTAIICEEERQRRMIYTAEALGRGARPPPPMTPAEWEVAMAWNQHQRELLETYYKDDPPAFLLSLQQLQFQYLLEQKALADERANLTRVAHEEQVAVWNAYVSNKASGVTPTSIQSPSQAHSLPSPSYAAPAQYGSPGYQQPQPSPAYYASPPVVQQQQSFLPPIQTGPVPQYTAYQPLPVQQYPIQPQYQQPQPSPAFSHQPSPSYSSEPTPNYQQNNPQRNPEYAYAAFQPQQVVPQHQQQYLPQQPRLVQPGGAGMLAWQ